MKAMTLRKPGPIETNPLSLAEVPAPEPGPGEIRVRVSVCGVCRTDLHVAEGELTRTKLPIIPGHEIVGVVDKLGGGTSRFALGQRVGIAWLNQTCGECEYCREGKENLCDNARFTGYLVDGGYAEYAVISEDFAYAIPEGFPDLQAAPLLCAGVIGFRSLRLTGVGKGEWLGLYGFGASAHIVIQVARHWGCRVAVFGRPGSIEHQKLARKLGADWVGATGDRPPEPLHASIIFAPVGSIIPEALKVTRKGGTVVSAGIYMSPIPEMSYDLLYHERVVRSAANSTRQDAVDLLSLAAEIPIRTEVHPFPLEQANEALQRIKAGTIAGAAVLVTGENK